MASAIFTLISGMGLLAAPDLIVSLVKLQVDNTLWLRIAGLLTIIISLYYYAMLKQESTDVFRFTVWGRLFFAFGVTMFVVLGVAPSTLILFGTIDFVLAAWTHVAIRKYQAQI